MGGDSRSIEATTTCFTKPATQGAVVGNHLFPTSPTPFHTVGEDKQYLLIVTSLKRPIEP